MHFTDSEVGFPAASSQYRKRGLMQNKVWKLLTQTRIKRDKIMVIILLIAIEVFLASLAIVYIIYIYIKVCIFVLVNTLALLDFSGNVIFIIMFLYDEYTAGRRTRAWPRARTC